MSAYFLTLKALDDANALCGVDYKLFGRVHGRTP